MPELIPFLILPVLMITILIIRTSKLRIGRDPVQLNAQIIAVRQRNLTITLGPDMPVRNLVVEVALQYVPGNGETYTAEINMRAQACRSKTLPQVLIDASEGGSLGDLAQRAKNAMELRKGMLDEGHTKDDVNQRLARQYDYLSPEAERITSRLTGSPYSWRILSRPLTVPILLKNSNPRIVRINYEQF